MQIESIDPKSVDWRRNFSDCRYLDVYKKIEDMQIGEAISVTFDVAHKCFAHSVSATFKRRNADFSLKIKKIGNEYKTWKIMKIKIKVKKAVKKEANNPC